MLTFRRGTGPLLILLFILITAFYLPAAAGDNPSPSGWRIKFDESGSNPVIADGVLYAGSADGAVYALDPNTGQTKWSFQTGENLSSGAQIITVPRGTSLGGQMAAAMDAVDKLRQTGTRRVDMVPAVENGTVFIGSGDHSFYAIDAKTGQKKWSYEAGGGMASNNNTSNPVAAALVRNNVVYFTTDDGLHAVDALTGKRKWLFGTLQEVPAEATNGIKRAPEGLALGDGVIFVTAWPTINREESKKSFLYAVDLESGTKKWVATADKREDVSAPVAAQGLVFFSVSDDFLARIHDKSPGKATLYAVDAVSGQIKWTYDAPMEFSSRSVLPAGNAVYFATDQGLFAVELTSGRPLWSFIKDKEAVGNMRADEQHLYVVTGKDSRMGTKATLHALNISNGQEIWSLGLGENAEISTIRDGIIYTSSDRLRAIDATTGKEVWSFKGDGRVTARLFTADKIFLTSPTTSYVGMKHVDQGYLYAIDAKTGKLKP